MNREISITLTPAAIAHIKSMMARTPNSIGLRLSMKKYGCNGYGYAPTIVTEALATDMELALTSEFRFFLDPKYAQGLNQTTIDFIDKKFGQKELVFQNPNVEGECGCGESVNFKDKAND